MIDFNLRYQFIVDKFDIYTIHIYIMHIYNAYIYIYIYIYICIIKGPETDQHAFTIILCKAK